MDFITIVTGLPRSGSTLMMRMLEAGGMTLYYDNSKPLMWKKDGKYFVNYNIILRETNKIHDLISGDYAWLNECLGKVLKVLTPTRIIVPEGRPYKFIYMDRNVKHISASLKKYADRSNNRGFPTHLQGNVFIEHLRTVQRAGIDMLSKYKNSSMIIVKFGDVIKRPKSEAIKIQRFLNVDLDIEAMAKISVKRSIACLPDMLEEQIYVNRRDINGKD